MGNVPVAGGHEQQQRFMKRDESFGSKSPLRILPPHCHGNDNGNIAAADQHERQKRLHEQRGERMMMMVARKALAPGMVTTTTAKEWSSNDNARQQQQKYSSNVRHRSQSIEQSNSGTGTLYSPCSSRSSSSNSYINSILLNNVFGIAAQIGGDNGEGKGGAECNNYAGGALRQTTEPMFTINGDLTPHQIGLVKRAWKQAMKLVDNCETEIAIRLLLRIYQLDSRNLLHFSLVNVPLNELRGCPVFMAHVKAFEPTLVCVMSNLTNATMLSKQLQQLGGKYVNYTGVTYKCCFWKCFTQALTEVLLMPEKNVYPGNDYPSSCKQPEDLREAIGVLGDFCVEQMRIGYRIEYKLQREAERLQAERFAQQQRRRRDLSIKTIQNQQQIPHPFRNNTGNRL